MTTKNTRYAHSEGHLDLCFSDSGEHLVSGGTDGDVRIFHGFNDEDPEPYRMGEIVYAVACKRGRFYSASSDNTVSAFLFPSGEADGLVTRFTAPATHIVLSSDGKSLAAGSSDFTIRVVEIDTSQEKVLRGHDAPVLSVALHPTDAILASSSCDGTVRLWSINDQKVIHTVPGLPRSNHSSASTTLCRVTWDKEGKHLMVPMDKEVKAFKNNSWEIAYTLTSPDIVELVSVLAFSPTCEYLAAGCRDGTIIVWHYTSKKAIFCEKHNKKVPITALAWNPNDTHELVYADANGYIGQLEEVVTKGTTKEPDSLTAEQIADLFDDQDEDMLVDASNPAANAPVDDSDSDDDECNISKIKAALALDGEDSKDVDPEKSEKVGTTAPQQPVVIGGFQPTALQPAFQSSACPVSWSHRFMLWNSVGLILQYDTEDEQSINVEFHDTATHHAIHIANSLNHTMASLSAEALVLACKADSDDPSQVVCNNFGAWDSSRPWSCPMPDGEDIEAVCVGDGWLAVATDKRLVRIFSTGGIQKEMFSLAGPVVALAGHSNQLLVVYHAGMALPGDQCLGVQLMYVSGTKRKLVLSSNRLPISAKSTLAWLGFTAEGTPAMADSSGMVQLLNRRFGNHWQPAADLKSHCKGKSDNYWVVGLHENPAQIRAILVKGGRYPGTLPRPTVHVLDYKLPLCELTTDKGMLEESYWRGLLLSQHLDWWETQGYECSESQQNQATMSQSEALMKQFALACKSDREHRALEICELMPNHHSVQLATKYASRLRRMGLAERLSAVTLQKAEAEAARQAPEEEEEEEEEDFRAGLDNVHSHVETEWSHNRGHQEPDHAETNDGDDGTDGGDSTGKPNNATGSLLSLKKDEAPITPKSISNSQVGKKNPFKKLSQQAPSPAQGTSVFDSMEKSKSGNLNKSPRQLTAPKPKKVVLKKKSTGGMKMFQQGKSTSKDESNTTGSSEDVLSENVNPAKSAFQLWYEEHRSELGEENPEKSESDLTILAAKTFKTLDKEAQQIWKDKAKNSSGDRDSDLRKRKREEDVKDAMDDETSQEAKKKCGILSQNTSTKLAAFAFNKS